MLKVTGPPEAVSVNVADEPASGSRTVDGDSLSVPGVGVGVGLVLVGAGLGLVECPGGGDVEATGADEDPDGLGDADVGPAVGPVVVAEAEAAGLVADPGAGADEEPVVTTGLAVTGRPSATS
jgi:hypothetical protein